MNDIREKIIHNFRKFNNSDILNISLLKQSGSYRKYYRISFKQKTMLGVFNPDKAENDAFIAFAKHFKSKKLNVPEVYNYFPKDKIYFIEDLGQMTLYDFLLTNHSDTEIISTYKKILLHLFTFQTQAIKGLDLSKCYPRAEFDEQSIFWDLNYFKYFVLKQAKITFNEQKLENDFHKLSDFLTNTNTNFFLYRDFQSKNIIVKEDDFHFIDFQGGRKGAVYYDLASLLFDSKANLSEKQIYQLAEFYYSLIAEDIKLDKDDFFSLFYHYALIRLLQAFGAYGFRGLIEKKIHFISSIPKAIENIKTLLKNKYLNLNLPELKKSLTELVDNSEFTKMFESFADVTIRINSFSFLQNGYPKDNENNGGGFVFDCRFLPNPGKYDKYKKLTGLDSEVIDFLEPLPEVEEFIVNAVDMIRKAAQSYQKLGYNNLQVNFGCTGGRHRSVFCAQKTAELLQKLFDAKINLKHLQQVNW